MMYYSYLDLSILMVVHVTILDLRWRCVKLNTVSIVSMIIDVYLKNKKLWLIHLDMFCYKANISSGLPHGNGGYHFIT